MNLLAQNGYLLETVSLPPSIRARVESRDWVALDSVIRDETLPGGVLFEVMKRHAATIGLHFNSIEFIIAIRPALDSTPDFPDEDGIWHDDGSRVLAFSLSLTLRPEEIQGGILQIRPRLSQLNPSAQIPTPPFGTMIVFQTGAGGYEHKIGAVVRGERVIIAGWCS